MNGSHRAADIAAVSSVTAAGTSWLSGANEIMTFIGSIIAIVAGCFAIAVHLRALRNPPQSK